MAGQRSERVGPGSRGLSFGSVAELYERYRPGYPDDVVDAVLRYAGRPVRTAVEVGAGTGKATRLFASRGIAVTAVEPDPDMARVLDRTVRGLPVQPVVATFEQFVTARRFDLLYAAAAWHWTDRATRWTRTVELLVPGGVVALFGRPGELTDPDLAAAVAEVERALPDDGAPGLRPWSPAESADVPGLTDRVQLDLPGTVLTAADEYVGRLATVSAYLMLDPEVREDTLRQVRAVLPERVELDSTVRLSLARAV
ncbi:MAG TPA: methyltransferase domain-containing protein [Mycobacteriales bacterium]|nr:methyltransferase domain-containing protein [Mycobacteriales bacterium]